MDIALCKTFNRLRIAIDNYLHLGNDPFDILQVLFMLLAVKKKVKLNFTEDKVNFFETDDEILNIIHYAASIFPNQVFRSLKWLYDDLIMIPESDFDKIYRELLYGCINRGIELTNITPSPILYTIASYIHRHNYKSVINVPSGLPYLSIHLSSDIKYLAVEQRIYLLLLGTILCDDNNVDNHEMDFHISKDKSCDVYVSLILNRRDTYHDRIINEELVRLAENAYQCKCAFIMLSNKGIFSSLFFNGEKINYLADLFNSGHVESVITFDKNELKKYEDYMPGVSRLDHSLSLVILNYEKKNKSVSFYAADNVFMDNVDSFKGTLIWNIDLLSSIAESKTANITLEEVAETEYSLNAYTYLQNAECSPGQELVRLKNVADKAYYLDIPDLETPDIETPEDDPFVIECQLKKDILLTSIVRYSEKSSPICLIPDTDFVEPEYLAYVLKKDRSFIELLTHVTNFDFPSWNEIMHHMIPIFTDKTKQREVLREISGKQSSDKTYNIVYADASCEISEELKKSLIGRNITLLSHVKSVEELIEYLGNGTDSDLTFTYIDAVVFNAEIPYTLQEEEDQYEGFREIIMLKKGYEIPFYVISNVPQIEITIPKRNLTYFTDHGRFYSSDKTSLALMVENLVNELNYLGSDDSFIRNKYPDFYTAAEWIDIKYPGLNIVSRVSQIIKQDLTCNQGDMEKAVNDIRIIAENLIRWMQELNIAPPAHLMTPGEVARLIRDSYYKEYTFTEKEFMYKPLASMLVALFDVGNYGSHKFFDTDLYRRTAAMILMSFVQWIYEKKEFFERRHEGLYVCVSSAEKMEFIDVVQCDTSRSTPYYYCRNVHLQTSEFKKLKAGDKVRITDYSVERYPREGLDVCYFSKTHQWSKIEDEK